MVTNTQSAVAKLRRIVGDANVMDNRDELVVYECDGFPVAKGMPSAVVFPTDTQQVVECVKTLNEFDIPIVPRGSGTGLTGACVAYDGDVIIVTSKMDKIEKIDIENRMAVVQAGVRNTQLSDAVSASGLHFSPDPSSQTAATIAGNAATNAGGINTLKHGITTNHILGVEMVLSDGSVVTSRGNGCCDGFGADITALTCGSEGTLGIITKLWCRLVPKAKYFRTMYAVYNSTLDACKTVADVIATGIVPTSMEMMDGAMIQIVEDAFSYGFPRSAQALLLIEVDGVDEILDEQAEQVAEIAKANNANDVKLCSDQKSRDELWSARKRAFGAIGRISPSYCTQDACVPRSKLPEVVARVTEIGEGYGLKITNAFHAGDGNIHPVLLFDEDDPEQVQRILDASFEILRYCISEGGTITGEHGVGVEKITLMEDMFNPETIRTFQQLKATFDGKHAFNEAKLIPSDLLEIEIHKPTSQNSPGGAL